MKHQEATYVSDKNISLVQNFNSPYMYGDNIYLHVYAWIHKKYMYQNGKITYQTSETIMGYFHLFSICFSIFLMNMYYFATQNHNFFNVYTLLH